MKNKSETQTPVMDVLEELTEDEERERHRLEIKVDRALSEGWFALKQLRDRRLYRSTHKAFEEYVKDRFGYNRAHAYRLIKAAQVIENLSPNGRQNDEMSPNGRQILPNSERLCRELAKLPSQTQPFAWEKALEVSDAQVPKASVVRSIVEQLQETPRLLASDYCFEGETFFLQRLSGADSRYNGCWAVAIEVDNRFTVKAAVYDGFVEVRPDQMKQIDSEESQAEIREIYERIKRLIECQLDPIDEAQIEFLCRRPWFTLRQKQVLSSLEKVYLEE